MMAGWTTPESAVLVFEVVEERRSLRGHLHYFLVDGTAAVVLGGQRAPTAFRLGLFSISKHTIAKPITKSIKRFLNTLNIRKVRPNPNNHPVATFKSLVIDSFDWYGANDINTELKDRPQGGISVTEKSNNNLTAGS